VDHLTKEKRSHNMAKIKSMNTKPEITVRSVLHRLGYRFRLNRCDLPGSPDIVLPKHKVVIFVHGCFWHGHIGCKRAHIPASNIEYWTKKINKNCTRDILVQNSLMDLGWRVFVIWECELKNIEAVRKKLLHDINS
jgi:DNA mismatch endonuclease (patch repair protein)